MIKLDLKDRKILFELDLNSRQSFHQIAKKVGLSKDSVIYRVNKLQKQGIIRYFHTNIDVGKLGFISFRLYLKFHNTTPQIEAKIIEFLKKKNCVTWLVSTEGEFDVGMWILVKKVHDMNLFWKDLHRKYLDYLYYKKLSVFTKVTYFPRSFILDKENLKEYDFLTEPKELEIKQKDREILNLLAPNSRITVLDIAKNLNITTKTVTSRIKYLEKQGIIKGYRTFFDIGKLGYQYFKLQINLHHLTPEKEKMFRTFIKHHPNIIYDNEAIGGNDIEIDVQLKDLNELRNLITEIKKMFADIIRDYTYMSFYKEHKYVFLPV